jgi:RNA-directed DNA polymerase
MSSHDTKNPTEGVSMRRVIEPSNPDVHLLERVLSRENMQRAWKRVRANKGAPGIDSMTIEAFPEFAPQTGTPSVNRSWQAPINPRRSGAWRFPKIRGELALWGFPLCSTV